MTAPAHPWCSEAFTWHLEAVHAPVRSPIIMISACLSLFAGTLMQDEPFLRVNPGSVKSQRTLVNFSTSSELLTVAIMIAGCPLTTVVGPDIADMKVPNPGRTLKLPVTGDMLTSNEQSLRALLASTQLYCQCPMMFGRNGEESMVSFPSTSCMHLVPPLSEGFEEILMTELPGLVMEQ